MTAERLACGCPFSIQTDDYTRNPLHLGRKTRRIRGRLARAVHHRDGGHCQAPGCHNRTTQIHHILYWTRGGVTCIDNLISLCDSHHWLVHEGGWSITWLAPKKWLFQRPDGIPMPRTPGQALRSTALPHNPAIAANAIGGNPSPYGGISEAIWWLGTFGRRRPGARRRASTRWLAPSARP